MPVPKVSALERDPRSNTLSEIRTLSVRIHMKVKRASNVLAKSMLTSRKVLIKQLENT